MFERSFFGFFSSLVSRCLFSTWTTAKHRERQKHTRRAFRDHKKREKKPTTSTLNFFGTREREREREREDYTQRALSPHKKQNVISSHTHARIPFPVAAPPLEKDGRRRFASATTCARSTRRLKSSSRARSLLGAKVSKRRREEAI